MRNDAAFSAGRPDIWVLEMTLSVLEWVGAAVRKDFDVVSDLALREMRGPSIRRRFSHLGLEST